MEFKFEINNEKKGVFGNHISNRLFDGLYFKTNNLPKEVFYIANFVVCNSKES
jgi:hypothetical protein